MRAMLRAALPAPLLLLLVLAIAPPSRAQPPEANYEESKVGQYPPLDPLTTADGRKVTTPDLWTQVRRPELFRLFETEMYGRVPEPPRPIGPTYLARSEDGEALDGKAVRREVTIVFGDRSDAPRVELLIYLPKGADKGRPVPAFLGLNFGGNHTIHRDPGIALARVWKRTGRDRAPEPQTAPESSRGSASSRWPVERIIGRGYALATAYYEDIDPDFDDGFKNGVHPLFYRTGQTRPAPDEWGSIAAWAWGLSRALDCLQTMPEVDAKKVVVMGHSRLGKTALWAGATDPRFAVVISNNSGCGGAALSRRIYGETVGRMNRTFPHWLCANSHKYSDHEETLPFDQHELIALIAPRPVLVCSAEDDKWADPKGEFLGARGADPVYRLLGTDGLAVAEMPKPARDSLVKSTIGYRIRPGKHDVTVDDWVAYMDFADHHLGREGRSAEPSGVELPRAGIDGTGPGWRPLVEGDFAPVNGNPDTWTWKDGVIHCTGRPVGVIRVKKPVTNFELVAQWRHLRSGGNSGIFVWAPEKAFDGIRPGRLPRGGIEVQILDHGYTEKYEKQTGKKANWFTTHGDVFPVGTSKMRPFPPISPDGSRSFPTKRLSKGVGQWNHYYIRAVNGEVRLWVNGQEVSGGNGCEPASGYLCLESEGAPVEFRELRIRELP